MRKLITFALCTVLIAIFASGCVTVNIGHSFGGSSMVAGRGNPETYTYDIDGEITEIKIEFFCNIEFYATRSDIVTLEIQPNLMEYVTVEESDGILTVRGTRGVNITPGSRAPVLTVGSSALSQLSLAGAGNFTAHDTISGDSFTVELTGAGNGTVDLDVDMLSVSLSGAGNFSLSGAADKADISMAGAGRIDALELQTSDTTINMAGAGTVRISCSDNLSINAGGVGSVEYRGSPSLNLSRGGVVSVRQIVP